MKILAGGALAVILLIILIYFYKKGVQKKEQVVLAEDKLREEALDNILLNKKRKNIKTQMASAIPVEVNYAVNHTENRKILAGKKHKKAEKIMVQIIEKSELSVRKYVMDPHDGISIGSRIGKNHIVINSTKIDEQQCEIMESAGKVYVHNIGSSGKVILNRGKQNVYVEQKYIEMKSGDAILLDKIVFKIDLIKPREK